MEMAAILREVRYYAQKKRTVGLTEEEATLQQYYRDAYMKLLKQAMRGQIEGLKVVDPEGNDVTPDKLKAIQKEKGIHGRHLEV